MSTITRKDQQDTAAKLRNLLSIYEQNYDLISIGAYKSGTNPVLDEAIKKITAINHFLMQGVDEAFEYDKTVELMKKSIS